MMQIPETLQSWALRNYMKKCESLILLCCNINELKCNLKCDTTYCGSISVVHHLYPLSSLKILKPRFLLWSRKSVTSSRTQLLAKCGLMLQNWNELAVKGHWSLRRWMDPLLRRLRTQGQYPAAVLPSAVQRQAERTGEMEVIKSRAPLSSDLAVMLKQSMTAVILLPN